MQPFSITKEFEQVRDIYPGPNELIKAGRTASFDEQQGLVRLWLSEGIPFAFREVPGIYEIVRGWLGARLKIHPKTITIIGSGRIGYSLAPYPAYGRTFSNKSDLDFAVVSDALFSNFSASFVKWQNEVTAGVVRPRNSQEQRFWSDNLSRLPLNIRNGFIDEWKLPRRAQYPEVQNIAQTIWILCEKLRRTPGGPSFTRASIRIYRNWDALVAQMHLSFSRTVHSVA
jgi:hypothetical protein